MIEKHGANKKVSTLLAEDELEAPPTQPRGISAATPLYSAVERLSSSTLSTRSTLSGLYVKGDYGTYTPGHDTIYSSVLAHMKAW